MNQTSNQKKESQLMRLFFGLQILTEYLSVNSENIHFSC